MCRPTSRRVPALCKWSRTVSRPSRLPLACSSGIDGKVLFSTLATIAYDDASTRMKTSEAIAREAKTQRLHAKARSSWVSSSQPSWLTSEIYSERIQPRLVEVSTSTIASRIGVSRWYAGKIRQGYRPHPRHWLALAQLVCVHAIAITPAGSMEPIRSSLSIVGGLPCVTVRSAPAIAFRGLLFPGGSCTR